MRARLHVADVKVQRSEQGALDAFACIIVI
jgi:hypothetical protein